MSGEQSGTPWVGVDVGALLTAPNRLLAQARLEEAQLKEGSAAVAGVLAAPGEDFMRWLVCYVQRATGLAFAFVGEVWGADRDRVRTVSVCHDGNLVDNFEYDLQGTPCANVMHQDICAHPQDVANVYPDDELLEQMGISAYIGMALTDAAGTPLGLMVVLDTKPIPDNTLALAVSTLELLRERVSAELRYRATLWNLEVAVAGTAGETLEVLVESFAQALHIRSAFVGRYLPGGKVSYPAVWTDGKLSTVDAAPWSGTPAEMVRQKGALFHSMSKSESILEGYKFSEMPVETYCAVAICDREGNAVGLLGLMHDRELPETISGGPLFRLFRSRIGPELLRWDAEEQQQSMQRRLMEAQRREGLGTMAGGIAHDFNNLLVGILGNADLLLQDAADASRESLEIIVEASEQASALCQQLLVYVGQGNHVSKQVDLRTVVAKAQKLSAVLMPSGCELHLSVTEETMMVRADPVQLQQVALNLIKNAAEALDEPSGTIRIELGVSHCESRLFEKAVIGTELPAGRYCCIAITDNGSGMSDETLKKVFDPFFSTKSRGHGLGLATVLGIVQRHSGALLAESTMGKGTCFRVYLPENTDITGQRDSSIAPLPVRSKLPRRGKVLLIDDETTVRTTLEKMLRQVGFCTLSADSGRRGVELFAQHQTAIACVILDLRMPEMTGTEVLLELRKLAPNVRVLLATAFPEEQALKGLPRPPDALLIKPFVLSKLVPEVERLCEMAASETES